MKNRMYDPKLGRFLSRDPLGYADGAVLYSYARSAPTLWTDPLGLLSRRASLALSRQMRQYYGETQQRQALAQELRSKWQQQFDRDRAQMDEAHAYWEAADARADAAAESEAATQKTEGTAEKEDASTMSAEGASESASDISKAMSAVQITGQNPDHVAQFTAIVEDAVRQSPVIQEALEQMADNGDVLELSVVNDSPHVTQDAITGAGSFTVDLADLVALNGRTTE